MIKIGETIVHIIIFLELLRSVAKQAIKLIIVPINPIGLKVETNVRIAPVLKKISPNWVV